MCHTKGIPWDKPRHPEVEVWSRNQCALCGKPGATGCLRCPPDRGGAGGGGASRCQSPWSHPASRPGDQWATASELGSVWRERAPWGSERGKPRTLEAVEVRRRKVAAGVEEQEAVDPRRRNTDPRCVPCSVVPLATPPPAPPCACFACVLAGAFSWERCAGRSCREFPPCPLGSCKHPATREQSDMKIEHTIAFGA